MFDFFFFFGLTCHPGHCCLGLLSRRSTVSFGSWRRYQVREGVRGRRVGFYADAAPTLSMEHGVRLWGPRCVSEHFQEVLGPGDRAAACRSKQTRVGAAHPRACAFPANMTGHLENIQYFTTHDPNNRPPALGQGKRFHHLPSCTLQW